MDNGFPEWYKIDELLPPMHKDVLGFVADSLFPDRSGIYMAGRLDGGWWVRYSEGSLPIVEGQKITHWRFLPNPPR